MPILAKIPLVATLQNRLMSQLGSVDIVGYSCVKETSVRHLTDTEHPASSSEWEWMLCPRETVHLVTSLSLICNALKHISNISIVLGMCPVSTNAGSCVVCWCCYGYAIQKGKQRWPPRPIQVYLMILFFSWRGSIKFQLCAFFMFTSALRVFHWPISPCFHNKHCRYYVEPLALDWGAHYWKTIFLIC